MIRKKTRKPPEGTTNKESEIQETEITEVPEIETSENGQAEEQELDSRTKLSDQSLDERIRALERRLESVQGKYQDVVLTDALKSAYLEQGGLPAASETAVLAMRAGAGDTIRLDKDSTPIFVKPDGEPLCDEDGLRLTPETFVRLWLAANPIFLQPESRRGSGSSPSEPTEISAEEILRQIRSAKTPEDILRLAGDLGIR